MKLKGAFWPQSRTVPCAKIQAELGCDPIVASFFPTDMVKKRLANEPVWIHEATEAQWRYMAEKWKLDSTWDFRSLENNTFH